MTDHAREAAERIKNAVCAKLTFGKRSTAAFTQWLEEPESIIQSAIDAATAELREDSLKLAQSLLAARAFGTSTQNADAGRYLFDACEIAEKYIAEASAALSEQASDKPHEGLKGGK